MTSAANRILGILVDGARASVGEMARAVGMSAPSVSERIKRLQEDDPGVNDPYQIQKHLVCL